LIWLGDGKEKNNYDQIKDDLKFWSVVFLASQQFIEAFYYIWGGGLPYFRFLLALYQKNPIEITEVVWIYMWVFLMLLPGIYIFQKRYLEFRTKNKSDHQATIKEFLL
jgi:hypothetical protein